MVKQVLLPDADVLGGEFAQARGQGVHVQVHDLGPGVERHWQFEAARILGGEPPPFAYTDVFTAVVFGGGSGGFFFRRGDSVGACCGAGAEEVFRCAVGYVGFCCCFCEGV